MIKNVAESFLLTRPVGPFLWGSCFAKHAQHAFIRLCQFKQYDPDNRLLRLLMLQQTTVLSSSTCVLTISNFVCELGLPTPSCRLKESSDSSAIFRCPWAILLTMTKHSKIIVKMKSNLLHNPFSHCVTVVISTVSSAFVNTTIIKRF